MTNIKEVTQEQVEKWKSEYPGALIAISLKNPNGSIGKVYMRTNFDGKLHVINESIKIGVKETALKSTEFILKHCILNEDRDAIMKDANIVMALNNKDITEKLLTDISVEIEKI